MKPNHLGSRPGKSRIANIRRKMIRIERRLKKIDEEITKYLPPPPPPPPA